MKLRYLLVISLLFLGTGCGTNIGRDSSELSQLWPEIEPFQSGYLQVSDIHEVYYELCGNPEGKAVFALHGGPGGSISPTMRRFFNPEKFLIVLHDQRGAGKSKPVAETRQNTTWDLVEDIERLRKYLNLKKIIIFGGSWGSTLGLTYAETYPDNVSGMVLRGIFLATQQEIDHFYHGGVRKFFPDVYDRMLAALPDPHMRPLPDVLLALVQSQDSTLRAEYSREWARYEFKISLLDIRDEVIEYELSKFDPYAFALLENYYMVNDCFLGESQLLENAHRISHIPITLVNGRYDMICPPVTAYRLHQKLPGSELRIVESAGHWMGERPIKAALLSAMRKFE
ncbi:MAG: prolyl aminopeptidase [Fidelibacterota bacterium]|nr:MAG: prolyl aminopeptidase [Candidatus Neomarinimicrobiota bacterium]